MMMYRTAAKQGRDKCATAQTIKGIETINNSAAAELQDAEIKAAKNNGTYDECGIIKPHGESIAFRKKEVHNDKHI